MKRPENRFRLRITDNERKRTKEILDCATQRNLPRRQANAHAPNGGKTFRGLLAESLGKFMEDIALMNGMQRNPHVTCPLVSGYFTTKVLSLTLMKLAGIGTCAIPTSYEPNHNYLLSHIERNCLRI